MATQDEIKQHKEALKALQAQVKADKQAAKQSKQGELAAKQNAIDEKDTRVRVMQKALIDYKAQKKSERENSNIMQRIVNLANGNTEVQMPARAPKKPRAKLLKAIVG